MFNGTNFVLSYLDITATLMTKFMVYQIRVKTQCKVFTFHSTSKSHCLGGLHFVVSNFRSCDVDRTLKKTHNSNRAKRNFLL